MTRGGRKSEHTDPERRCIVTGDRGDKTGLLRFVTSPDGEIVPDILGKLPGRGIWVTAERDKVEQAASRGLFARGAKAKVRVPDDLADEVERQLTRRVIELISLTRKAGYAVCGFEKVKSRLADGDVRVLLQAGDGSGRQKGKLWTPQGARYFDCLSAGELGVAFGRESVVHGALSPSGLSDRVVEEAAKLKGFREKDGGQGAAAGKDIRA